ncbi:hypothetical protein PROFUN_01802 [Planoprotostelium fungivorum]|uniref:Uncharacterized protein n=1 Tax=Planoprotostelium fungivorum TaxID=1890364 RepID=A0A2P6NYS1_9EUKA|nr:hypothetical protein PROFUN_01802 [Planoprotostelium fungivorum]
MIQCVDGTRGLLQDARDFFVVLLSSAISRMGGENFGPSRSWPRNVNCVVKNQPFFVMCQSVRIKPAVNHLHRIMQLLVKEQGAVHTDTVFANGYKKNVYYTIKAQPFIVRLALQSNDDSSTQLDPDGVEVKLYYDVTPPKEVDEALRKPLSYLFKHRDKDTGHITLEVCISLLTTQVQGTLFILEFVYKQQDLTVSVMSEPIRVISKLRAHHKTKTKMVRKPSPRPSDDLCLAFHQMEEHAADLLDQLQILTSDRSRSSSLGDLSEHSSDRDREHGSLLASFMMFMRASQGIERQEQERRMKSILQGDAELSSSFSEMADLFQVCSLMETEGDGKHFTESNICL